MPPSFHPLIREWFTETYGKPTAVQAEAWPLIEQGEHVLALAPTGSGKTLTAFLSAISRFCPAETETAAPYYPADKLTVLYVSPLKALNEDIKRNLLEPLAAIRSRFETAALPFPPVRVETRSGDTPQSERRRFLIHPPSILALTPESLAILLLNPRGRQALSTVKYLILDEIHAVLGNKRGAFLSCQIDRLALVAGEFQRISLSATISSPKIAAEFIGGLNRSVRIVSPPAEKQIEFRVEYPDEENEIERIDKYGKRYTGLINYVLNRISAGASLLVFTDSRRRAERLCYFLNQEWDAFVARNKDSRLGGPVAFTHHGSLSKELRRSVEKGLAEGSLPCVVATASLELGIDIGSVDEVVLAGSPGSVSQALQRIGRSGHGVGKVSRGSLFPFHGMDLLLAAALKGAVEDRDIEEIRPVENPLDILAQIILALCTEKTWNIEELYTVLRGFYIFRNVNRDSYNRTVCMLAGLGEKGRLREIKPRIWLDKVSNEIGALDGSLLLLYSSGGVIANRGLYSLRLTDGTKIGELDEEFVWERRLGDCFDFGGRGWRIINISAESVEVVPLESRADFIPFWKADAVFRSPNLSRRLLALLDQYSETGTIAGLAHNTDTGTVPAENSSFSKAAMSALKVFLDSQRAVQGGTPLPGSRNITVEIIDSPESRGDFYSVVIHSFRGGAIHYPLSLALAQELEEKLQLRVESFSNDDGILFLVPGMGLTGTSPVSPPVPPPIEEIFRNAIFALESGAKGMDCGAGDLSRGERLFRNRLESSGIFGANFREAAERSLLLPRAGFGKRTPLWITRQRSKRLFDAVYTEDGFPITAEAWRSCLKDMFDIEGFRDLSGEIHNGTITLSFFRSHSPSPFSRDMVRQETGSLLYEYDERKDMPGMAAGSRPGTPSLSDKVIQEALGDASLRPRLKRELVAGFVSRLRREIPGWTPDDELALCEWVKERIAIPLDEWEILCAALPEKPAQALAADPGLNSRLKTIQRKNSAIAAVVHREWAETWEADALTLLGPWLRYEGTVSIVRITEVFGASAAEAEDAVSSLAEIGEIAADVALEQDAASGGAAGSGAADGAVDSGFICDRENLDMLLRLSRKKARPLIKERPAALLTPFLALRQGIEPAGVSRDANSGSSASSAIFRKNLAAWIAPAKLWETEILTTRSGVYHPENIDREIREGRLVWYGAGREKIGFCRPEDLDLTAKPERKNTGHSPQTETDKASGLAPALGSGFFDRPRDFWEIKDELGRMRPGAGSTECAEALWREVWQGRLSADSLEPLRRALEFGFVPKDDAEQNAVRELSNAPFIPGRQPRLPKALRDRWRTGAPVQGRWFSLATDESSIAHNDPLEEELLNKDRVRLLLDRWGILCRPLLEHEASSPSPFSWSGLLPTMRRMELAGELIAGRFFAGINSLQFASPAVIQELEKAEAFNGLYWMNAADPASPAGLEIEGLDPRLCSRLANSRLYFRGAELVAVSSKGGKDTHIFISPDDPDMALLISLLKIPRTRKVLPESKIVVEQINRKSAAASEYAGVFQTAGFVSDRGKLCCW
ncbi:DEAD/DEAH box helicase [Spirochaetia bacterium]|nr:DEAD/DEAH box helicase [Spirochaetia bacterium]